jgi:iron complex outermembrane receptor protein
MKKSFVSMFLVIFPLITFAQRYTITGKLLSEITRTPVANANIVVEETGEGVASSSAGKFRFEVSDYPATLRISHIGFEEKVINLETQIVGTSRYINLGTIYLTSSILTGEEVLVTSSRAIEGETPVAFSTLSREEIERSYSHQDVPMVLADLPGVYSYSDAGNGVGYTYLKIRGFTQDRIGVMLNGIPLNDPEAHAVYWVDHGDILAGAGDIQLQRGVGNSLYGTSVFGGTVNMITNFRSLYQGFTLTAGYGNYIDKSRLNFPSRKFSLIYAGGPWIDKGITGYARYSDLSSEGYRIGSGTQQNSIHLGIEKNNPNSMTKVEAVVGTEVTAFSWEGIIPLYGYNLGDRDDRRYNYYADPAWNGGREDANKDVFTQSIISVQHSQRIFGGLFSGTLYNVKGDGYYEQFKGKTDPEDVADFLREYNLLSVVLDTTQEVGLIRRKWLKNGYWGFIYQFTKPFGLGRITIGGDARFYKARHFGKVIEVDGSWTIPDDHQYYFNKSWKTSFSFYVHSMFNLSDRLNLLVDARYLGHRYSFDQDVLGAFTKGYKYKLKYDFLDPRIGLRYKIGSGLSTFANVSTAHREPADGDIYDHDNPEAVPAVENMDAEYATPLTKEEFLVDYEAGLEMDGGRIQSTVNIYRMDFRDELIPVWYRYYDADDVLHANVPRTIHQGLEATLKVSPYRWLNLSSNIAYSDNHFVEFYGDSLGWGGWGGIADYSGKVIPAYPSFQAKNRLTFSYRMNELWIQVIYTGKQYIDFTNTEEAAIDAFTVVNLGTKVTFPLFGKSSPVLKIWINNLFDTLYETFGYNYYDGWPPYRVDAYWPAATRNFYVTLTVNF